MADGGVLREISVSTIAIVSASAANLLLVWRMFSGAPKWFEQWISLRRARAEEKAADWNRRGDELKRLSDRCITLEKFADGWRDAEKECRDNYASLQQQLLDREIAHSEEITALRNEVAALRQELAVHEGYQIGRGDAAQDVTILESTKRLEDDNK